MSIKCNNCDHINPTAKPGDLCAACSQVLGSSSSAAQNLNWIWKIRTIGLKSCEGTIIHIEQPPDKEDPDPDMPGALLKVLLFLDVFLVLGSLGLVILGTGLICIVFGLIFSIGCILPVFAVVGQVFLYSFIKTLLSIGGKKPDPVSVTKYEVQTPSGNSTWVKLKGNIRGASLKQNDRVIFWGIEKDKTLLFRCAINSASGVPYLPLGGNSVLWLGLLVLLNLVFIVWILISMAFNPGGSQTFLPMIYAVLQDPIWI